MSGLTLEAFHQWLITNFPKCSYTLYMTADVDYHPAFQQKDFLGTITKHSQEYKTESSYQLHLTKDYFQKSESVKIELQSKTLEGLQLLVRQECLLSPQEQQAEVARMVQGTSERLSVN